MKGLNFYLEYLGSGDQWSESRWKGKTLEMQISATTLPESRDSSTMCGTEWGPAFSLHDSQSSFCLETFISNKLWENIHAVLVIGYSGPTSDPQVTHGDGGQRRDWQELLNHQLCIISGTQIFQQGTCPDLFNKSSRNWEPNIQIWEPGWGEHFHSSHQIVLCFFFFLWKKESRGSRYAGQGHRSPWKLPVQKTPASALWTFCLSSLKCLHEVADGLFFLIDSG